MCFVIPNVFCDFQMCFVIPNVFCVFKRVKKKENCVIKWLVVFHVLGKNVSK